MKSSPTPPDPFQTAAAQTQSNLATAKANQETNMVDQTSPYGSLKYAQIGTNPDGTPKYSATTTLAPGQQGLLDQSNANKSAAGGIAGRMLAGGEGALSGHGPDLSYDGTAAALDKLNHARLDPQWADNTRHQEDVLASRGITAGTPAYDNAMRVFNQGKNDAYNSANLADYDLSSRNTMAQWAAPLSAYGTLSGMSQPTNFTPMNTPNTNVAGTNIAGLINSNYQQQSQNVNAQNGQLAGVLGTAAGALIGGPLGGMAGGALGGLFGGSSPEFGDGNQYNSAYGGNSSNPLPGLTKADYGPGY